MATRPTDHRPELANIHAFTEIWSAPLPVVLMLELHGAEKARCEI